MRQTISKYMAGRQNQGKNHAESAPARQKKLQKFRKKLQHGNTNASQGAVIHTTLQRLRCHFSGAAGINAKIDQLIDQLLRQSCVNIDAGMQVKPQQTLF